MSDTFVIQTSLTDEDIKNIEGTLTSLRLLVERYGNIVDMSALEEYDSLKKQMAAQLETLSTFKAILSNEFDVIENYVKKEARLDIVALIQDEKKISFTQADKVVENDKRYIHLKKKLFSLQKIAEKVNDKYKLYLTIWQAVIQSVATASKEKNILKTN